MITENMFLNTHYILLIFHAIFDMQQNDIEKNNPPPPPPQPSTLCLITRHQVLGFLRRPHTSTLTPHPPSPLRQHSRGQQPGRAEHAGKTAVKEAGFRHLPFYVTENTSATT